jgi:cytochrome c-type biogenesis protein CcsB
MMDLVLFKITLAFYFLGTAIFLAHLARRPTLGMGHDQAAHKKAHWTGLPLTVTGLGFGFHTLALLLRTLNAGYLPITHLFEAMSFFSWALILTFLGIEYRYRIPVLGSFALPLAFILLIPAAILSGAHSAPDPQMQSIWLYIHITFSVCGMVAFALAFFAGIMYLLQERLLKSKRLGHLYHKLPSLDLLDTLNQKAILWGFPLMTLGMISGSVWAEYVWGAYWSWDPKQTVSLGTWLFYLVLLHGRITVGWRAKQAAVLAIIGFIGVLFTFIGVNALFGSQHAFV